MPIFYSFLKQNIQSEPEHDVWCEWVTNRSSKHLQNIHQSLNTNLAAYIGFCCTFAFLRSDEFSDKHRILLRLLLHCYACVASITCCYNFLFIFHTSWISYFIAWKRYLSMELPIIRTPRSVCIEKRVCAFIGGIGILWHWYRSI